MSTSHDLERTIEFEFVRATENAALNVIHWLGRGEKEAADAAACDAIYGVFDLVDIAGEVVIGEGIKDNAPGIFLGEQLGTWRPGSPRFDIALDPVDGTTNTAQGLPNAISVMAASERQEGEEHAMKNLPTFYARRWPTGRPCPRHRRRHGPARARRPDGDHAQPPAQALGKRVPELVVMTLNRPRHADLIAQVRKCGAALRLISDGDITAAVSPSLADSGVDLFYGIGGSPEGILTAAALKALGGEMLLRMWPRDDAERAAVLRKSAPPTWTALVHHRRTRPRPERDLLRHRHQRQPAATRRAHRRQKGDHPLDPHAREKPHRPLHPRGA